MLAEAVVTTFLTVLLGMLMAATVATFARPSADLEHRARLALEANLAAEALAYDLSGYLLDSTGSPTTLEHGRAVRSSDSDPTASPWSFGSDNKSLSLSFTSPGSPDPTVVIYRRQGTQLVRTVAGSSDASVVAGHVVDFSAYPCDSEGTVTAAGTHARIVLTLAHDPTDPDADRKGNCSATYVLIAVPPR